MADWQKLAIIGLVILAIGCGIYMWFSTSDEVEVVVVAQSAVYEVPVQDFQARHYEGWIGSVPADAYDRTEERRKSGQTCTKIGKITTCTNRYNTWVKFTADRWAWIRNEVAYYDSPQDDLQCPDPKLGGAIEGYGSQRALPCVKRYSVDVIAADKPFTCHVESDLWFAMKPDTKWAMKVGKFTGTPWCDTLGGNK